MLKPKSFSFLVLVGFIIVCLPLLMGLLNAERFIKRLADSSITSVHRKISFIRKSKEISDSVILLERNIRQFWVLEDGNLLSSFAKEHQRFDSLCTEFLVLASGLSLYPDINKLLVLENNLFSDIYTDTPEKNKRNVIMKGFEQLNALAHNISMTSNELFEKDMESLQRETDRTVKILFLQAMAVIPISIALIVLFSRLVAKPIQQIDQGIRNLSEGNFVLPISVRGPADLEYLGERLDWLRERLAELEKEKNRFTAHISHELKTPLASIKEGAALLAEEITGRLNEQQMEIVTILQKNSIQLQQLIENILALNMALVKSTILNRRNIELDILIREILEDYKVLITKKRIHVDLALSSITAACDRPLLRSAVDNLISNAMKYTPDSGEIKIAVNKGGVNAEIDVMDSGPGIAPEDHEKIFQPFYQGAPSLKNHAAGTGLGLTIAKEYVRVHGGSLELQPNTAGTHFKITLPLSENE